MGNITINADDLGMKSSVNKAIVESFSRGFINSATLMANMAGFEEAVTLIHDHKLDGKIGVHLVLTEGLPITDEIKSMNLLFNKKNIPSNLRMRKLFFLNKKDQILIYKEYSAQIERVMKNGIQITHLDTHHQIHDMWAILQIMIELLKTYNIPSIRILNNLEKSEYFHKNTYRNIINYYLKVRNFNFTNFLGNQIDFLLAVERNPDFLNTKNNKIEIMVHPDFNEKGLLVDKIGGIEYDFQFQKSLTDSL